MIRFRFLPARIVVLAVILGRPPAARAQDSDSLTQAAAAITPAGVARELAALAADSLRDRVTPSAGLERAAQYVAAAFERLGLEPGASGLQGRRWLQRYPVPGQRHVNYGASGLLFVLDRKQMGSAVPSGQPAEQTFEAILTSTAYLAPEVGPQILPSNVMDIFQAPTVLSLGRPVAVVAGRQSVATIRRLADSVRDRVVLYLPEAGGDTAVRHQVLTELYRASQGVVALSDADSAHCAAQAARQASVPMVDDFATAALGPKRWPWAIYVWQGAVQEFLEAAGIDISYLRSDTASVIRLLPRWAAIGLGVDGREEEVGPASTLVTAPNVIGMIQGSDPKLRNQYVVVSAHLDNPRTSGHLDSLREGAADNTAGVASLLAVATAFTHAGVRPRRSVVFLATSGSVEALWGAHYFVRHSSPISSQTLVADLDLDLTDTSGRSDSVRIAGLQEISLPTPLAWVAGAHPELTLPITDGGTAVRPRSDHFPFAQVGVPSLSFRAGRTAETVADVARLVFYLANEVAVADQRPEWNAAGREHLRSLVTP